MRGNIGNRQIDNPAPGKVNSASIHHGLANRHVMAWAAPLDLLDPQGVVIIVRVESIGICCLTLIVLMNCCSHRI